MKHLYMKSIASEEPICAVVYEAITYTGNRAVRPVFLRNLQSMCRDKEIGFFEDAVMTGGRCGSLFLGDHHNIRPDAIAFGKCYLLAGVIVQKENGFPWPCDIHHLNGMVTSHGLKTTFSTLVQRVKLLKSPGFFENVRDIGRKIVDGLNERSPNSSIGLGCLIFSTAVLGTLRTSFNRILPSLNSSHEDIHYILDKVPYNFKAMMVPSSTTIKRGRPKKGEETTKSSKKK